MLTCWIGLSCLKHPVVGVCHFAVDLLNWEKIYFTISKISYIGFFLLLTCWIGLFCLTFLNVGVCHFAVDLLNWKKIYFTNPKISYRGIFHLLTCWIGLSDLLNWEKIYFTNSKVSYIGVFSSVDLLNWAILGKICKCESGVCEFLVDLLNWKIIYTSGMVDFLVDLLNWVKIYSTNSKISYMGVFSSVDLLNWAIQGKIWTFLAKISECVGMSFCCWLVELRKNIFQ